MRHRDRVAMALAREEPDRCPMQVSFTPEFAVRLREDLGVRGLLNVARGGEHNPHGGGNTYELERAIDSDLILTSVGWANNYYAGHDTYTDEWGVTWKEHPYETPFGTGHYTEMVGFPLAEDDAIDSYLPPDPARPELYADSERVILEYGDEYWIVGVTVTTIWETAWALRGYERLLMDLLTDPELADRILDIPFQAEHVDTHRGQPLVRDTWIVDGVIHPC